MHDEPGKVGVIADLRSHARFSEAVRTVAAGLVEAYQRHRFMNQVFNDRGSAVIGLLALYLHFCGGPPGLTVGRLQSLCAETAVCSRGRAAAMLALMQFARHLVPIVTVTDRRIRSLAPTERPIAAHREWWAHHLEALALLAPEGAEALAQLDEVTFLTTFLRHQFETFRAGFRITQQVPVLAGYLERSSGLMVLLALLLATGETSPPVVLAVSNSDLSRRFFVSRAHVRDLLHRAERDGFIERWPDEADRITVLPKLTQALETFVAVSLSFLRQCARAALDDVARGVPARNVVPVVPVSALSPSSHDGSAALDRLPPG